MRFLFVLLAITAATASDFRWTEVSKEAASGAPTRRYAHAAVPVHDQMLVTHGYLYEGQQRWLDDSWIFYPSTARWHKLPVSGVKPDPRYSHTLTLIGEQAYLFGGDDGSVKISPDNYVPNPHKDLWVFDKNAATWTEIVPKDGEVWPEGRAAHGAWAQDGSLFIFGGYPAHSDLWKFTPGLGWTELHPRPNEPHPGVRFSISMVLSGELAYVFGGYRRGSKNMQDIWSYDYKTNTWHNLLPSAEHGTPPARGAYGITSAFGNDLLLFGGAECSPVCKCYNDLWRYHAGDNVWEKLDVGSTKPPPRYKHSMIALDEDTFLVFGGEGYRFVSDYHNDVWQLRVPRFTDGLGFKVLVVMFLGISAFILVQRLMPRKKRPLLLS